MTRRRGERPTPLKLQQVYDQWVKAVHVKRLGDARFHATVMLDAFQYLHVEPEWKRGRDRTKFYNWCDSQQLLPKKKDSNNR